MEFPPLEISTLSTTPVTLPTQTQQEHSFEMADAQPRYVSRLVPRNTKVFTVVVIAVAVVNSAVSPLCRSYRDAYLLLNPDCQYADSRLRFVGHERLTDFAILY